MTRVWFHRARALGWLLAGAAALTWWRDSIIFVIVASVYANMVSDWTAAEAADDSAVLERLDRIDQRQATCHARHTAADAPSVGHASRCSTCTDGPASTADMVDQPTQPTS